MEGGGNVTDESDTGGSASICVLHLRSNGNNLGLIKSCPKDWL